MEELIELVAAEAGITWDQAKVVAEIVGGYLLSGVSEPCGSEIASQFGRIGARDSRQAAIIIASEPDTKYSLLKVVEEKAGITMDQAERAARATDEYIRGKVSEPCGSEIASQFGKL